VGEKNVSLNITTEGGCEYSVVKTITVIDPPVAAFAADPQTGAVPLDVQFTNHSTGADAYDWTVNGNLVSNAVSPLLTFDLLGDSHVALIASNSVGCMDEETIVITTQTPLPDVDLKLISFSENADGTYKVIITVHNKGNTVVRNLPVDVNISGNFSLREIIEEPIRPNMMYNLVLSYGIQQQDNLDFLCATAELDGDLALDNNRICKDFENSIAIVTAYPNPARDLLSVEWVAIGGESVTIMLIDSFGKKIREQVVASLSGLNQLRWNTDGLNDGIYILSIDAIGENGLRVRKTQRILISNQN
jgi:PKD repeat protein